MREGTGAADTLAEHLAAICARYPTVEPNMVAEILRVVLDTVGPRLSARTAMLLAEVEALGRMIVLAKAEIAALRAEGNPGGDITAASNELDAVVTHTAAATDAILGACELLDEVGGRLPDEVAATLQAATTHIYEACSFQDITGQRIGKVIATLKTVEARVEQIMARFGRSQWDEATTARNEAQGLPGGTGLLNGPQLPGAAMLQADVDASLDEVH